MNGTVFYILPQRKLAFLIISILITIVSPGCKNDRVKATTEPSSYSCKRQFVECLHKWNLWMKINQT